MKVLLKTTKEGRGRSSHYHIVYINDETGVGLVAVAKDHTHPIAYEQAVEMDAMGNQVAGEAAWVIGPGGKDNHIHAGLEDYTTKETKEDKEDDELVSEVLSLYKTAKETDAASYKKAEEAHNFYLGEQWHSADKQRLELVNRPALTFNEIRPKVDLLVGYQSRNRTDYNFLPVEGGDQRVCDILKILVKNIIEQNEGEQEETAIFKDGTIGGRGFWNLYIDYDKNIRGDIVIERYPWDGAYLGPHEKVDCSDLEYLVKYRMYSIGRLKEEYPEHADKIQEAMAKWIEMQEGSLEEYSRSWKRVTRRKHEIMFEGETKLVDIAKKNLLVIECWQKEFRRVKVVALDEEDFVFNADGWKSKDISALKSIGFRVFPRTVYNIRKTKTAGTLVLEDEYPELATNEFHLVPFYAYKEKKYWQGKVEDVKDPQREINKRVSQLMDIVNKNANYGWFYYANSFKDLQEQRKFEKTAAMPGFMAELKEGANPPIKTEGVKVPTEMFASLDAAAVKLRQIMNINEEMLGETGSAKSGVAIQRRQMSGLIGNEFLFDNFSMAKRRVGRILVSMIQQIYTPERILRIIQNEAERDQSLQIGGSPYAIVNPETGQVVGDRREELLELLNNEDITKYDAMVAESPWSPSIRMETFMTLMQLAQTGVPVPPQIIMEIFPNLPTELKNQAIQALQEQMQQQQEMEMMKYRTEIAKSEIAAQSSQQQAGRPEV